MRCDTMGNPKKPCQRIAGVPPTLRCDTVIETKKNVGRHGFLAWPARLFGWHGVLARKVFLLVRFFGGHGFLVSAFYWPARFFFGPHGFLVSAVSSGEMDAPPRFTNLLSRLTLHPPKVALPRLTFNNVLRFRQNFFLFY